MVNYISSPYTLNIHLKNNIRKHKPLFKIKFKNTNITIQSKSENSALKNFIDDIRFKGNEEISGEDFRMFSGYSPVKKKEEIVYIHEIM